MNYKSFLLALALCPAVMRATDVKSPDGRLVVSVDLQNGTPVYKVNYKGGLQAPSHGQSDDEDARKAKCDL